MLLVRLTSGLHDNDDDIIVHIRTYTLQKAFTVKRKKTDDDDDEEVFVRTNWISWINTWKKEEGIDIQYIERCLALLNRQKNEK
jgi:plasmid replication initiation protein